MVLFFTTTVVSPPMFIYMGADKHENEELLRYAFPEDIWFHVDKLSSAHVYLRPPRGTTINDVPLSVIEDCAQLVKYNSIQGNKANDVNVVYTPFPNLKKTGDMAVGQVGFHKGKEVRSFMVEKRKNEIVNRLNKTKREPEGYNLREEWEKRQEEDAQERRQAAREEHERQKEEEKRRRELAELRSYSSMMQPDKMETNDLGDDVDVAAYEEDFM